MATFQIKKEELEIAKEWIKTGEVNIYMETITEEKTFTVPIKREELYPIVKISESLKYKPSTS